MQYLEPKWKYDPKDKKTWKYIDCIINRSETTKQITSVRWILNPNFAYKHLDTIERNSHDLNFK